MFAFMTELLLITRSRLKSQASLEAENIVLCQQIWSLELYEKVFGPALARVPCA